MCQLKYGLPHHHVEKPDRKQRAENRRQLKIQGAVAARDVEFGLHVKEHDRPIHANRNNDAEEHRVFLPPPLHPSVKAAGKKNRECGEGDHVPEPCRHEPAAGAGQVPDAEDGIGDDGEAHRNPHPIDSAFCEIGPVFVFNGRVVEPEAEADQKRGGRLRPDSSAPGFRADAVSQIGRSFGLGGRTRAASLSGSVFGSFTRASKVRDAVIPVLAIWIIRSLRPRPLGAGAALRAFTDGVRSGSPSLAASTLRARRR